MTIESEQRAAVVAARERLCVVREARSWIGTPYHNCADIKGVGVDCGMLLVRVFVDSGIVPPFDPRPYPADWHLHRSEEKYLGFVLARGGEVAAPEPGDIAVFKFGRSFAHGGIVTRAMPLTLVHAYHPARCVIEDDVTRDQVLAARTPRFFSVCANGVPLAALHARSGRERFR
jgi:hypothetical protein